MRPTRIAIRNNTATVSSSALRGVLELYRATHDPNGCRKVETEWEGILTSGNLLPQGALPEIFKPLIANDEGCSEADWLRLNLGLWAETRNPRYLDNAELTLFNEFFFNQFHTGDFGHHKLTDEGIDGLERARLVVLHVARAARVSGNISCRLPLRASAALL